MKGFLLPEIKEEDYIFGSNQLGDDVRNIGGHWKPYLPIEESQFQNGFETYACVSEAVNHAIQMLINQEYGEIKNLSDRFLATASGTGPFQGNNPATVVDTLRKQGCCLETEYPFTAKTFAEFYQAIPSSVKRLALDLTDEFVIGREWVANDAKSMLKALEYSPLVVGVYAWTEQDGMYIRPAGAQSEHATVIYDYVEGQYWMAFDSYAPYEKKLAWDFGFTTPMRLTLHRQIVNGTWWQKFLQLIHLT